METINDRCSEKEVLPNKGIQKTPVKIHETYL